MKRFTLLCLFAIVVFADGAFAEEAVAKGLSVHEWGVFRISEDADFANAALRAEWDDLPAFVYGHIKGRTVPVHWGAFEQRLRPIIFFHAEQPVVVRVRVGFPGGTAGVWFPATEIPAMHGSENQPKTGSALQWHIGVKSCPNGWHPKSAAVPAAPKNHWIERVRQVKSDEIFARYHPNNSDVEREKFIYYDGMFPQVRWLKINVDKARVQLTSLIKHAVFDVTVVDRRKDVVRVGRIGKLGAGIANEPVEFKEVEASRFMQEAPAALIKQLVEAGLNDDEAKSLVDTWRHRMFETPGLTVFYRLPQEIYDAVMPLSVWPRPTSTVRVGLNYHAHVEPEFADRIMELVKLLDSKKFAERDSAGKQLMAIGPAALVQLQRIRRRKDLSIEVTERIDALVRKWSVSEAIDQ